MTSEVLSPSLIPERSAPLSPEQRNAQLVVLDYLDDRINRLRKNIGRENLAPPADGIKAGPTTVNRVIRRAIFHKDPERLETQKNEYYSFIAMRQAAQGFDYVPLAPHISSIVAERVSDAVAAHNEISRCVPSEAVNALQNAYAFATAYKDSGVEKAPGELQTYVYHQAVKLDISPVIFRVNKRLAQK